ncbi:hypothetical protein [Phaeovulum sp.]|uniref:hypothetical protein n=1 Tax=Phaeovulum sp. TaxID=2934796 RepID=UPI0027310B4E|nr:hypothetical protein [Phaeovulum sp.]MDP1669922.1 hypothetical protein [Phaeovulum sp.]MDZ4118634.1 hypothetical protein [Phaeovulum sp.]
MSHAWQKGAALVRRLATVLFLLAAAPSAGFAAGEVCVQNGDAAALVFTLENAAGVRARAMLAPGARLCLSSSGMPGGVVAVFEREDSVEGCSRLVGAGGNEELLAYAAFDRCQWAAHGR